MYTLYIDESGNTGETLNKNSNFNFVEQPFYVLTGILLNQNTEKDLSAFIDSQTIKFNIKSEELKASTLYKSKPSFFNELAEYITSNHIPFFVELMDKQFYLDIQLVEYFILPYYSLPINNENIMGKKLMVSMLGQYLNKDIYLSFIDAVKENTSESLENFYETLIDHFERIGSDGLKANVQQTKLDYLERKVEDPEKALREFFPLPDENPNKRLIHLLPNFGAFTNIVARTQKFINDNFNCTTFAIIHDEQKQFDIIFQGALDQMKIIQTDNLFQSTLIKEKGSFNAESDIKLSFEDSKTNVSIQVSDLVAGVIMRFWVDFTRENDAKINTYLPLIKKLYYPYPNKTTGINFVVPESHQHEIFKKIYQNF